MLSFIKPSWKPFVVLSIHSHMRLVALTTFCFKGALLWFAKAFRLLYGWSMQFAGTRWGNVGRWSTCQAGTYKCFFNYQSWHRVFGCPWASHFASMCVSSPSRKGEWSYSFSLAVPQPVHLFRLFIRGSGSHRGLLGAQHGKGMQSWLSQNIN